MHRRFSTNRCSLAFLSACLLYSSFSPAVRLCHLLPILIPRERCSAKYRCQPLFAFAENNLISAAGTASASSHAVAARECMEANSANTCLLAIVEAFAARAKTELIKCLRMEENLSSDMMFVARHLRMDSVTRRFAGDPSTSKSSTSYSCRKG